MNDDENSIEPTELLEADRTLYSRVVKGGSWVVFGRIATQILDMGKLIVILNLLEVQDIGLLAVATLMMGMLNSFSDTGINAALIQKKEDIKPYLDTAWTIGIIRGFVLFVIMYFAAPYVAALKVPDDKVDLTITLVRVIGASLLVAPFGNIGKVYFSRNLNFKKLFILDLSSKSIDFIVSIVIAITYRSVWAVVAGKLSSIFVSLLLSYVLHAYRPRLRFEKQKAKVLWTFGKWIFALTIMGFMMTHLDDLFVWGYLGIISLAYYQTAFKFAQIPAKHISTLVSKVSFPAYSRLQHDIPRLQEAYLKVLKFTAFLSVPVAVMIFVLAPDFVTLFLKEKWLPIVLCLRVMVLRGLIISLGSTRGAIYKAVGKPGIATHLHVIRLVMLVIFIYPATRYWGIVGTAGLLLGITSIMEPFGLYLVKKTIQMSPLEPLKVIVFPLMAGLVTASTIFLLKHFAFENQISFLSFTVYAFTGIAVYLAISWLFDKFFKYDIIKIFKEQLKVLTK
jgi:O-antigen/teichoic acid export membrane protein